MTQLSAAGAAVGLFAGLGAVLIWTGLPRNRRPGLSERLLPYLRDDPRPSRLLSGAGRSGGGIVTVVFGPIVADLAKRVDHLLGAGASVRRRLQRAGLPDDLNRFRAEQVVWGVAGAVAGAAAGGLAWAAGSGRAVTILLVTVLGGLSGLVAKDYALSRAADRREQKMVAEFPTIAELLALAVAAGEGAVGALDRVTRLSRGELSAELARCLADARAGANLPVALQGLADRTGLVSLARFVDGIVVAVERGTPLAEVLRAQAQDAREAGRQSIIEEGGKKEILMMVPVVFLVLPVTVLFAVYPGFSMLRLAL